MFESWAGPPTTDAEVVRKRRLFLLALVGLFAALALVAVWLGFGLEAILIVAALVALVCFALELFFKRRAH